MAKTGRVLGWIGKAVATVVAVLATVFTVDAALELAAHQGDQNAYDHAPYCRGVTNATESCVLRTDATVVFVDVTKNTGKNAHGHTTSAFLDPKIGGQEASVVLSSSEDLSGSVAEGDTMPVLVWRDRITRFTFAGRTHDSDANPHRIVAGDLVDLAVWLIAATVFGRPRIRRLLRNRIAINLHRNRIPDWTLLGLVSATAVAALLRASYAAIGFGLAGVAVLVLSAAWPFVPWVATPSAARPYVPPYVPGQRAAARKARAQGQARSKLP
ncbi:hypothetical protein [Catenulispora rubra]|uniref:hypothetical protein n=1 Tax=Catenulispora rubra TaxID=280293 RepID=UPI001891FAC7|nr:hypothetical protein [Catenulispora rubra]